MITKWQKIRTFIILITLTSGFFYLILRLYQIQLVGGEALREKARRQHQLNFRISPERGIIYDRKGRELAVNITVDSIYIRNTGERSAEEIEQALSKLMPILNISEDALRKKLSTKRTFTYLARKVKKGLGDRVKQLNLSGVNYTEEIKRSYPKAELAANILGFTGIDEEGLEGLELYYNRYLKGVPGWSRAEKDARGWEIILFRKEYSAPLPGLSLSLTVDEVIQHIAERELERAFLKFKAKGAIVIVMEPKTGNILALANQPTFDPNNFQDSPASSRRNRAISDGFEPGSTFKIVTAAAALEEKLFTVEDKIFCEEGSYRLAGHTIHDVHPQGELSFGEVFKYSSNIGTVKIAQALGREKLYQYIIAFGFSEKTGIDLPGEAKGLVRPPHSWSKLSLGAIPYGQEIMVTAIQLLSAVSAVANKGVLMQPRLVSAIIDEEGKIIKEFIPREIRRVISSHTAEELTDILVGVVEDGTGKAAGIEGYRVAGKTGTAQKAGLGGYISGKYFSSFVGYFPAEDPELAILVVLDEPRGAHYGGRVAAPVFQRIGEEAIAYLKITGIN